MNKIEKKNKCRRLKGKDNTINHIMFRNGKLQTKIKNYVKTNYIMQMCVMV